MEARLLFSAVPPGTRVYSHGRDRAGTVARDLRSARPQVSHNQQTDEHLVSLVVERDVQALETLYDRHARAVYSLALKMLGEPTMAEEVVQECFLKLWRQPLMYQAARGKVFSW